MGALMERFAARAANIVCTQTIHGTSSIRPPPVNKGIHQPASVKEIFHFGTEFGDRHARFTGLPIPRQILAALRCPE